MATSMTDIRDSVIARLVTVVPADYKELAFIETIEDNSSRTDNNRYAVRALEAAEFGGVTKTISFDQSFEVVLTKNWVQNSIDDIQQVTASYENRALIQDIYVDLVQTKGGLPGTIINISNLVIAEPEYLLEDKVAVQRATMNIKYRLTL